MIRLIGEVMLEKRTFSHHMTRSFANMEGTHLSETFVQYLFYFAASGAVAMKLLKLMKQTKIDSKWLNKFQWQYFICYFSFMNGLTFQGPYVYQRYIDSGLEPQQISVVMSTFNIVSAIWGFCVGYATELLGHKQLIIISAMFLSLHATFRYIGGFWYFVAASALMGISTASNKVVFEDWLMSQLRQPDAPKLAQATIQENTALIRLLITLVMTPVSSSVTKQFGSGSAFCISALMFFTSALIIAVFMNENRGAEVKVRKSGYLGALRSIFDRFRSSNVLRLMLLLDFAYNVFYLLYSPRWLAIHQIEKKERLPLSQMSSTSSVALMNGAQLFGIMLQYVSPQVSVIVEMFMYLLSILGIIIGYSNKNIVYLCYVFAAICDGGLGTSLRMLRGSIYPDDVRGYILGFIRIPTSLTVSFVLFLAKAADAYKLIMICAGFLAFGAILAFALVSTRRK